MSLFSSLRREQKEAIGLLQIGTFLEYFDLMLYVHMAVLLNELFFPKTDPHTASLLSAFAFCSTFVFRPFGALIFGYIGDHIGRKTTVIITTMMMSISCIVMATLPTYSQIGISAAWIITICRMAQGISSLGEIVGAEVYLTEIIKPPARYPFVALIAVFSVVGTTIALVIASLVTSFGFNWRNAFWIGAAIALVGSVARTRLRETPDFVDMKRKMKKAIEESTHDGLGKAAEILKKTNLIWKEKPDRKTSMYFFLMQCAWPICFYYAYIHCGNILKGTFGYTAEQVIHQNLIVSIVHLFGIIVVTYLSYKIYPLKIVKIKNILFIIFISFLPYLYGNVHNPFDLLLLQLLIVLLAPDTVPAVPVFLVHFPIFKRFTYATLTYALSRALMYIVTSFGLVYLTEYFGHQGLWVVMIPINICFFLGVNHFEKLDKQFETLSNAKEAGEKLIKSPAS